VYFEKWRRLHRRVKGNLQEAGGPFEKGATYTAADTRAVWWVQATLIESYTAYWSLVCPERATDEFLQSFWELKGRRNFLVAGIPEDLVPPTYREFEDEFVRMWNDLGVTNSARSVIAGLQSAGQGRGPLMQYAMWSVFDMSIQWMPPQLADQFGQSSWQARLAKASLCGQFALLALFRSTIISVGAGRLLELSYCVEMRQRRGETRSCMTRVLNAIGRDAALLSLRLTLGPATGVKEDWS
jgi:uncharacterized protein (DUF2236 family)